MFARKRANSILYFLYLSNDKIAGDVAFITFQDGQQEMSNTVHFLNIPELIGSHYFTSEAIDLSRVRPGASSDNRV